LKSFEYLKMGSPLEASQKIAELGEDDARVIAGGTALVIMMKERILSPKVLLDISQVESMRKISYSSEQGLSIGSMVTHLEIESSPDVMEHYPSLREAFHTIGNVRIRLLVRSVATWLTLSPSAIRQLYSLRLTPRFKRRVLREWRDQFQRTTSSREYSNQRWSRERLLFR